MSIVVKLNTSKAGAATRGPPFVSLNQRHIRVLDSMVRSTAHIQAAITVLRNFLLGGGIRITKGRQASKLNTKTASLISDTWTSFLSDVLFSAMVYRIVIVRQTKSRCPFIVPLTTINLTYRQTVDGEYEVRGFYNEKQYGTPRLLKDALVFFIEPPRDGRISTPFDALIPNQRLGVLLKGVAARAAQVGGHPPLVLQQRQVAPPLDTLTRDSVRAGDATMIHTELLSAHDIESAHRIFTNEKRTRALNSDAGTTQAHSVNEPFVFTDPDTGVPSYPIQLAEMPFAHSIVTVPEGYEIARGMQNAQIPAILTNIESLSQEDTAMITGIPSAMFRGNTLGGSNTSTYTSTAIMSTFYTTQHRWRVILAGITQRVFTWIYATENIFDTIERKRADYLNYNKSDDSYDISVTFPSMIDDITINSLLSDGFIDFATAAMLKSATIGIPLEYMSKERLDPMTGRTVRAEEKRQQHSENDNTQATSEKPETEDPKQIQSRKRAVEEKKDIESNKRKRL